MQKETRDKLARSAGEASLAGGGLEGASLISDDVREIISYRPHWIIRKGNVLFFMVLLSILALTWVIEYPDLVPGSARLVALNAPKLVAAKSEGKLVELFVANEQEVQKGQHLGYMESTADYGQVVQLRDWINEAIRATREGNYTVLVSKPLPPLHNLGELQTAFGTFENTAIETKELLAGGYYQKRGTALQKDIAYLANLKTNTDQQRQLVEQDQELQQKEFNAYEALAKDKVIAPLELNGYRSKLIAKEQALKQMATQLTNSEIARHGKRGELLELEKTKLDRQQAFHSALLALKSETEKWMQQYVLVASERGKVLFTSSLQEGELIGAGQDLFYIQPAQTHFYAELMTGQKGLGKIRKGQQVHIKIESYPVEEYGYVKGVVDHIAAISTRRDSFLVKVLLPKGLITSYGKELFFRNNLYAGAEIITDDRRLFDRLTGQLQQAFKR